MDQQRPDQLRVVYVTPLKDRERDGQRDGNAGCYHHAYVYDRSVDMFVSLEIDIVRKTDGGGERERERE